MQTEDLKIDRVHHGNNIKRIRREKGIKQEKLSSLVNLSQQTVSRYESMKTIDDEMLDRFAKALDVSADDIRSLEEPMTIVIENNITDNDITDTNIGSCNTTNTFNPIDKVVELFERLLQSEKEKNDILEKRLSALEKKMDSKK